MRIAFAFGLLAAVSMPGHGRWAAGATPATLEWTRRISTRINDWSLAVSVDGLGNVYSAGRYSENPDPAQVFEVFVSRYDEAGNLHWTRRLNSSENETTTGVAADRLGNVFFVGYTEGSLGGPFGGDRDAYVGNYDAAGNLRWLHQFGDVGGEAANGVAVDHLGNAYVTGTETRAPTGPEDFQQDAFVRKYDSAGKVVWTQHINSSYFKEGRGIDVDAAGNIFVTGTTIEERPNPTGQIDGFVSKLSPDGTLLWTREFAGLGFDNGLAISADDLGNVYFAGASQSDFGNEVGSGDAIFGKYNAAGDLEWIRQIGSSFIDGANGVSADAAGNIYFSGMMYGPTEGPVIGTGGAFLAKYDASGNEVWTKRFGAINDQGWAMSTDGAGAIYVSGLGDGSSSSEPILFKLVDPEFLVVPEPGSFVLCLVGAIGLIARRGRSW